MEVEVGAEGKTALEALRYYAAQAAAKAAGKPVSGHMRLHHAVKKLIRAQRSYAPVRSRHGGGKAASATRETGSWSAPQLAQTSLQRLLAGVLVGCRLDLGSAGLTRIARQGLAGAWMSNAVYQRYRQDRALCGAGTGAAGGLAAVSRRGPALPSIAPIRSDAPAYGGAAGQSRAELESMPPGLSLSQTSASAALARRQAQAADGAAQAGDFAVEAAAREHEVKLALNDYLDRQGRLPPAGGAGFDPRLTPAWSGVKLAR